MNIPAPKMGALQTGLKNKIAIFFENSYNDFD
jgi:hypothetical protein